MNGRVFTAVALVALFGAACARGGVSAPGTAVVGEEAPGFSLPAAGEGAVSLSDYRGNQAVLLYFSMGPG